MARIDLFQLLDNLEADLDNEMDFEHPQRKLINAVRESIVDTDTVDRMKLAVFLERERARNR